MPRPIPADALRYEAAVLKCSAPFRNERSVTDAEWAEARRRVDAIDPPWSGATYNHWRVQQIERLAGKLRDARVVMGRAA